jgi:hypothetical protein
MGRQRPSVPGANRPLAVPSWLWGALGVVLVAAGLACNEWLLAALLSADGELAARNRWIVRLVQLVVVTAGAGMIASRKRFQVPVAGVVALCCALAVSPMLAELAVRTVFGVRNLVAPPTRQTQGLLGWQTKPHHQVAGPHRGYGEVHYTTEDDGFRVFGDPSSTGFKIFVIGDSSTEASQVSDGETYYEVMAELCPELEIFAYGAGGYGSLQEFLVLDAFVDRIDPQLIIWQFDWNDLINNSLAWESMSRTNNNLMTRPYLIDGEIQLRFPTQTGRGALLRLIQSSHLMRLMRITGRRLVTGVEPDIGPGHEVFEDAVTTTEEILNWVRDRAGDRPIAAFCLCPGGDDPHGRAFQSISQNVDIHYLPNALARVHEAKAAGEVVTGFDNGVEIDSHLNATGHRLLGESLVRTLGELGLIPCAVDPR